MPFDKANGVGGGLLRHRGGLGSGGAAVLGRLLRPFAELLSILLFQLVLAPEPGQRVISQPRMLLGGHAEVIIRRCLGKLGLRPLGGLGGMFPHLALAIAVQLPASRLRRQLGAVGPLNAHVLMLILINLAVDKAVGRPPGGPCRLADEALFPGRFLLCQLAFGLVQFGLPLLHAEFRAVDLLLLAFLPELPAALLWDTLSQRSSALVPWGVGGPPASRPGALGISFARIVCGGLALKAQAGRRALAGLGMLRPTRGLSWIIRGFPVFHRGHRLRRPVRGKQVCPALQWGRALRHWLGAVPLGRGILPALRLRRSCGLPHLAGGRLFPIRAAMLGRAGLGLPFRPKP